MKHALLHELMMAHNFKAASRFRDFLILNNLISETDFVFSDREFEISDELYLEFKLRFL